MELIVIIMTIVLIVLFYLLFKERQKRKKLQDNYSRLDGMLTRYVAENIDINKQLESTRHDYEIAKEMAEEIKRMQEQSRRLKHDMKNHTMVMISFFEKNQIKEAKAYAGDILDKLNKMYTYVNVGNSLMNYIINNKLSKAKEDGIDIKAQIENLSFEYIETIDFSALLNNVIDNAITAANNSKSKYLEVSIYSNKGMDIITVKNSIDESVLEINPDLTTTKKETGHGLGIKQIRAIIEKYNGDIDIYEKDGCFIISIMLGMSFVTK